MTISGAIKYEDKKGMSAEYSNNLSKGKKIKNGILFSVYGFVLGCLCGVAVWVVLKIMNLGIDFVWEYLPGKIEGGFLYTLAVCIVGGVIIGLFQRRFGILPDNMEEVMMHLKKEGAYPYDKLHIIACAALLPLIFGGALGPEAGLSGMIAGLCCWVGDRLKIKGDEARELAEAGMAATLGVIFNAPFFGLANNYEHTRHENKRYFSPKEFKAVKTSIYVFAIAGGFVAMLGLGRVFGSEGGIPRFDYTESPSMQDWKYFIVFAAAGVGAGILYVAVNKLTGFLAGFLSERRIVSCIIAGLALALVGTAVPDAMFSGEHQLGELMEKWTYMTPAFLVTITIAKMVLTNICISFGWRGGNIFPVIYSGTALGYGMALFTGSNPLFAVATVVAGVCGAVMGKPVTVVAVLFLCLPVRLVVPMLIAAYIGSFVTDLFTRKRAAEDSING